MVNRTYDLLIEDMEIFFAVLQNYNLVFKF